MAFKAVTSLKKEKKTSTKVYKVYPLFSTNSLEKDNVVYHNDIIVQSKDPAAFTVALPMSVSINLGRKTVYILTF